MATHFSVMGLMYFASNMCMYYDRENKRFYNNRNFAFSVVIAKANVACTIDIIAVTTFVTLVNSIFSSIYITRENL